MAENLTRRRRRRDAILGAFSHRVPKKLWDQFTQTIDHLIENGQGNRLPHALLETARPHNHPLHSLFEWNNSIAGEKYRLAQARGYIGSFSIVTTINTQVGNATVKVWNTVKIPDQNARSYYSVDQISRNIETRNDVEEQIRTEMRIFIKKYIRYRGFFGERLDRVITAMNEFLS